MVALLAYSLVKRSDWLRARTIKYASPRAILSFHVYAGVVGALLLPVWAAIAAVAAIVTDAVVTVEKRTDEKS